MTPLFAWEFSTPVKVAIALLGIAVFVSMVYLLALRDIADAGQCRLLYQRAHSAADSQAVDAQRLTEAKGAQMSCGELRRSGRVP